MLYKYNTLKEIRVAHASRLKKSSEVISSSEIIILIKSRPGNNLFKFGNQFLRNIWGKIMQTNFFYYCALFRSCLSHEKFNPDNSSRWMHLEVPVSRYKSKCNETYLYLGTNKDIVRNYDNSISWYLTISVFQLNVNFLPFFHLYLSLSVQFSRLRICS